MGQDDTRFNLLLVDDHPENLVSLKSVLDDPAYVLFTATSGQEALRLALREDFAVVLLDVVMPEMDGFEVATHLKALERTRNIPIIFLSAVATEIRHVYRAYDVGAIDYLLKPLDPDVVRKKVAVLVDITRQRLQIERQAELLLAAERREFDLRLAELRVASDERYRSLVDGIDQAIAWTMAEDGRFTFVSGQAPRVLGFPLERYLEPDFWVSHCFEEDRGLVTALFDRARSANAGKDLSVNHRMVAASGEVHWFHTGVMAPSPESHELHGVSVDVSDIKRAEQRAQRATDMRDQLLAIVSHDLRNPLTSILMNAETMQQDAERARADKYLRCARAILRSANHMADLIGDLVDLSKIEAGGLSVEATDVAAMPLFDDLVESLKPFAESKGLRLEVLADEDVILHADRQRTHQVLRNLLGNAIKFTPEGGRVCLRAHREGANAHLSVTDSGPGIAEADQAEVWNRFWHGRKGQTGSGLGLWIAKQLVEAQSGRIWLESKPGEGATFHVTLPLASRPG